MEHLRDSLRHVLAAVLMLGTLAGTVWTFSDGALTLSGSWERIVSVGGIAAALELGCIYTGWYIGQLDQRIQTARKRDMKEQMQQQQRRTFGWFYAIAGISAIANLIFRSQQLPNIFLAAFVSAAPIVLIMLFMIVLRPLPVDYADIGARATGHALTRMVERAERDVLRIMARMGRGRTLSDAQMRQLHFATSIIRVYARSEEQHALDHALQLAAPTVVESDAEEWIRTGDIATMYGISRRSAQEYMKQVPGRRKLPNSNAWEAPRSAVLSAFGAPRSAREQTQGGEVVAQSSEYEAQLSFASAQSGEDEPHIHLV